MLPRVVTILTLLATVARAVDPCATIAGQKWTSPQDVRTCFASFKVDPEIKANV
ncbi:uncharacterized protein PHACADRAFT_108572, partial [Phanerochaete carnosa HHB-10118-sp]